MPRAWPFALREQIVRRHEQGEPLTAIAVALQVPYRTARRWWQRYRSLGREGLHTQYAHCGPGGPRAPAALHATALALKREHPTWGASLIRLELLAQFPGLPAPQERTIQRWFQAAGLQRVRARRPRVERRRAAAAHEVWEIDAKEQMHLADGTGTSVLTVTDEGSGAILGLVPFPPGSLVPGAGE